MWNMEVMVGAHGTLFEDLGKRFEELKIRERIETFQDHSTSKIV